MASGADDEAPNRDCSSIRLHVPPSVNSESTAMTVRVKVSIPNAMPYFCAGGMFSSPKADKISSMDLMDVTTESD